MKFTCFIDTSSYINLNKCEYNTGTLLHLLYEEVTIRFSSEVNQEIANHYDIRMPDDLKRSAQIYRTRRNSIDKYRELLELNGSANDLGEKDNFVSIIDLFFDRKIIGLVFLTDDIKAIERGCLYPQIKAFPFYRVWNSLDVILFLFIIKRSISKDFALDFLRDINRNMTTDDDRMDPRKTQERINKFRDYARYLELISLVKNN